MRKLIALVLGMLLVAAPAQAGGGGGGGLCSAFADGATVVMRDSCFEGTAHFAPAGAALLVTNDGGVEHTFTAADGSFDSGIVAAGDSFEITFDEPGIIRVFCTLHGSADGTGMAGVLIVGEPTPEAMAAIDLSDSVYAAASNAVANKFSELGVNSDDDLVGALDRQTRAVNKLSNGQVAMHQRLDDIAAGAGPNATVPLTLEVRSNDWVPLAAGLSIGLGLAALAGLVLVARRRREDSDVPLRQPTRPLAEQGS